MNRVFLFILTIILSLGAHAERVISMSPTITEIIYELDQGDVLVGVSSFCLYPKMACSKPNVGTALTPDLESILKLKPTRIYSQKMENSALSKKAPKLKLKVENLEFDSFEDIIESIEKLGRDLGATSKAKELTIALEKGFSQLGDLDKKGSFLALIDVVEKMGHVSRVLVAETDTFYSDLISQTGMKNYVSGKGGYRSLTIEELLKKDLTFFLFSPKKSQKAELLKTEFKRFKKNEIKIYSFEENYAVIPGPRLILLINDLIKVLK